MSGERTPCACDAPTSFVDGTKSDGEVYEIYECDACGEHVEVVENTHDGTRHVVGGHRKVKA